MATREKKTLLGKKQNAASPVPPKEGVTPSEAAMKATQKTDAPQAEEAPKLPTIKNTKVVTAKKANLLAKKLKPNVTKPVMKKGIKINLKAKNKPKALNQKLAKQLKATAKKNIVVKNELIIKGKRGRKKKIPLLTEAEIKKEVNDSAAEVQEPNLPEIEKSAKNVNTQKVTPTSLEDSKTASTPSKRGRKRKEKKDEESETSETFEDLVKDLNMLIKPEDIKTEADSLSESSKSDIKIPKRTVKKAKVNLLKKKIQKDDIENTLGNINIADTKVIDMLDLNVNVKTKVNPITSRRHSIEKFPIGSIENTESVQNLFSSVPSNINLKGKRGFKLRQSVDNNTPPPRSSPYSMRSEVSKRMLRNGRAKLIKHSGLTNMIDDVGIKRIKRKRSELSGSEVSKNSGFESDSSFSSSLGTEQSDRELDSKMEIDKEESNEPFSTTSDIKDINEVVSQLIKRSPSIDTTMNGIQDDGNENKSIENKLTDTNSNLCKNEDKAEVTTDEKAIKSESDYVECISISPSTKVPEKSIILDIMKQTFNEPKSEEKKEIDLQSIKSSDKNDLKVDDNLEKEEPTRKGPSPLTTASFYGSAKKVEAPVKNEVDKKDSEELKVKNDTEEENVQEKETDKIKVDLFLVEDGSKITEDGSKITEDGSKITEDNDLTEELAPAKDILTKINTETEMVEKIQNGGDTVVENVSKNEPVTEKLDDSVMEVEESETQVMQEETLNEIEKEVQTNGDIGKEVIVEQDQQAEATEHISDEASSVPTIEESPEELAIKESMLSALGLRSLKAAEEDKLKPKEVPKSDNYTGTLKTVIKLNRTEKKKGRNPIKMTLQKKNKSSKDQTDADGSKAEEDTYKVTKENASTSWKGGAHSSDTAGALRKSHYSNRSNMDGSSEHTSDGDTAPNEEGKSLVIPEKASSFSIHPGRLCKDECSYCFGKFGLFDTPCHIAQMKSVERQDKILSAEKHLARDSCLCDACFRHIDRKSNAPSYANKSFKRGMVAPGPKQNHCHVLNCGEISTHNLRRKWIIKMRRSICRVINIDLDNPGLHSIPICQTHYAALEHLMLCAMCKRKLARNHVHYLGTESNDLNEALNEMGIPVKLTDRPVVCKLCRYFANLALKNRDELSENSLQFFKDYKKRLLHFHDIEPMDDEEAEEPMSVPSKEKEQVKKKKKASKNQSMDTSETQGETENIDDQNSRVPSGDSRPESPSDYMIDYNTLVPKIALECGSDSEPSKPPKQPPMLLKKVPKPESVKEAVEISKTLKIRSDIAVQRLGSNPSISVRQLFPGEEELPLQGCIDFNNVKEKTPEGWDKCSVTIQYDNDTKLLWQELQKPYGNQSSFLRHLILLEKYFRNGDLILSPNASHHSVNYSESVQNRLRAYDNIPSNIAPSQPPTMVPVSKAQKSISGILTSKDNSVSVSVTNAANIPKSTPITISQLNNSGIIIQQVPKPKTPSAPPGLMPLRPGTYRPIAPAGGKTYPQKIKFPITKNWRPNLIPIDPNNKLEKKPGLVQVISGGKPYHITFEDYKKMCAIKRTFDLRQKRLQETKSNLTTLNTTSVLKSITPKKGLVIQKTSTITSPPTDTSNNQEPEPENILEKLDKTVEKLESNLNDKTSLLLPKIPKSLTVIPQSVPRKPSRPSSPVLMITQKPKASTSKS